MDVRDQLGGSVGDRNREIDRFPNGMRVLAVDDDLIYLRILEESLRKCNYEVTTANDAKQALEILRENINKFDLVISDVEMPGMDGFQLLQHLGQEMDLPVIMISGYGDIEFIKKGISHGACCYLVKPVSIEVFKTIWQHAFRKKKLNSKDQLKSSDHKVFDETKGGEEGISTSNSSEPNGKQSKEKIKMKHRNEDDEECKDDDEDENEGLSTPKKRRVVWTEELKKKFNDVYYYLGPEKAVPKKILELMNVEGLSRGNVASHLQKFRDQLKKGNIVQHKQRASMVVNMGRKDCYTMPWTNPIDDSGGRLLNVVPLSSYMPLQMVSRSSIGQLIPNYSGSTITYTNKRLSSSSARNQNQDNNCECWQNGVQGFGQIYQLPSTTSLRNDDSNFSLMPANNLSVSSSTHQIRNTLNDFTSIYAYSSSMGEIGDEVPTKTKGHVVSSMHSIPNTWWEDDKLGYNHNWDLSSIVSSNEGVDPLSQRSMNSSMFDQFTWENTSNTHGVEVRNSIMQKTIDPSDGLVHNGVESLDDQVCNSVMIDQVELGNELYFLDRETRYHDV